ncbi:MAG TPA: hypothetical protein PLV92_06475, partial [Pirellulaceae bacterium]|nr:hypothetical protein [Pirellulaceae bacterium]
MKQLYYTSCVAGRSVSGQGGFQIRAVSRGLTDDRCRALLGHLSYRLPNGFDEDAPPADAPRRLALLNTNAGRVLVNSVHVGRDPTTGRAGNFFSHLLIDLPSDLDAGVAAALLHSNFWVAADHVGPAELPDLETLPASPTISPIKLSVFAKENADLIRFLFQGLLSVTEHQRLFVVAHPDDVAKAVLVVARMLPRDLRAALTFSTYEREPLSSPARIVGTYWRDARLDLESVCYDGAGFGFNTLTRRSSQMSPPAPFAAFALKSLAEGRESELAKFYAACGSMKLDTPERLELAYRVVNDPKPLSNREFSQAQAIPELAQAISGREDTARNVVRWAIDDPQFRDTQFAAAVRQAQSPASFYDEIAEQVVTRLKSGDIEGAKSVLEQLPPKISRDAAPAVYERIGGRLESAALPAKAQLFILPSLLRVKNVDARTRQRWLDIPADHLADLLKLGIDPNDMLAACECALEKSLGEPDPTTLAAVTEHPSILQRILDRHGGEEAPKRRSRDEEVAAGWAPTIRELIATALRQALDSPESGGLLSRGVKAVRNIAMTSYAPPAAMTLTRDLLDLYERRRLSETQFDEGLRQLFASSRFDPGGFLASTDYRRAAPQLEIGALAELTRRALAESPVGILDDPVADLLRRCSDSDAERRLPKD